MNDATPEGVNDTVTFTYTLTNLAEEMAGEYYCKVTYNETSSGAMSPTSYNSSTKQLFIREATISGEEVVELNEDINLTCTLSVESKEVVTSVLWYKVKL